MTRFFRQAVLVIALMCTMSMAFGPMTAAAQTGSDVDIQEVSDLVVDADPDTLLADLETPIANRDLPEGFADATLVDPDDESASTGLLDTADYAEAIGSVGYTITGDTEILGGLNAIVTAQIIVLDPDEDAADYLQDILDGANDEIDATDSSEATFTAEKATLNDVDTVVITLEQTVKRVSVLVHYLIVPVGNTFVITSVTIADKTAVDAADVAPFNEDLSLSMIAYLGDVAADAA